MEKGRAQQIATPHEVYTAPATEFVAGFIGSPAMNIFTVTCDDSGISLPGGHRMAVPGLAMRGAVRLGLRPEDIALAGEEAASFPVVMTSIEWLGADAFGYGVIEGTDVALTIRMPGQTAVARGDRVRVGLPADRLHFFSPEDGKRI